VELPIWSSVRKLVLDVPIDSPIWSVQLYETIVAQRFIMLALAYLVAIVEEVLISEFKGEVELRY
jgi:hypothetical protein